MFKVMMLLETPTNNCRTLNMFLWWILQQGKYSIYRRVCDKNRVIYPIPKLSHFPNLNRKKTIKSNMWKVFMDRITTNAFCWTLTPLSCRHIRVGKQTILIRLASEKCHFTYGGTFILPPDARLNPRMTQMRSVN